MPEAGDRRRLTRREVTRLVNSWIGVSGGYLGNFSYASHDRFWVETCDIDVDTNAFDGTTKRCFEETLLAASVANQAKALRAILEEYPPDDPADPNTSGHRTPARHREILGWITRLETGEAPVEVVLEDPSEVVRRALEDADNLMRTSGPQSAVDRVHTAMHGYLLSLCAQVGLTYDDRPTMTVLFKALQASHPMLGDVGPRSEEITRVLRAMANILDSLNPVRNNASVAHPNDELVGEPEARLVINTVRTLLSYLEAKRREAPATAPAS